MSNIVLRHSFGYGGDYTITLRRRPGQRDSERLEEALRAHGSDKVVISHGERSVTTLIWRSDDARAMVISRLFDLQRDLPLSASLARRDLNDVGYYQR